MTKICVVLFITLLTGAYLHFSDLAPKAWSAEPIAPPDVTEPKNHFVDLGEDIAIRMGDTISLNGTDFSARLVEFSILKCASLESNCPPGVSAMIHPEFILTQGSIICDSKKADRTCFNILLYRVHFKEITDRTAVHLSIENR